jgi:beta-glucanase (GH16 family)
MSDFTTVFQDDFNGSRLDTGIWRTQYSGHYGNGMFRWDPSQVEVGNGLLTIATEREGGSWVSGGLSTIPDGLSYGRYEFRARIEEGQGTAGVILLWPSSNQWTDEVDIIETNDPSRDGFAFSNHGHPNVTEYIRTNVDQWHTYTLDWTPGNLTLSVDGQWKASIDHDVPSQKMSFGMQGQVMAAHETWFGGAPDRSTPDRVEMQVDWVRVSAWTPGQGDQAAQPAAAAQAWTPPAASDDPYAAFRVDGQVDWHALSEHVFANFEATGQWFI